MVNIDLDILSVENVRWCIIIILNIKLRVFGVVIRYINIKVVWVGVEKINYVLKFNNCIFFVNNKKKSNYILMDKYMFVNCSLYLGCLEEEGGGGVICCVGWEYICLC